MGASAITRSLICKWDYPSPRVNFRKHGIKSERTLFRSMRAIVMRGSSQHRPSATLTVFTTFRVRWLSRNKTHNLCKKRKALQDLKLKRWTCSIIRWFKKDHPRSKNTNIRDARSLKTSILSTIGLKAWSILRTSEVSIGQMICLSAASRRWVTKRKLLEWSRKR